MAARAELDASALPQVDVISQLCFHNQPLPGAPEETEPWSSATDADSPATEESLTVDSDALEMPDGCDRTEEDADDGAKAAAVVEAPNDPDRTQRVDGRWFGQRRLSTRLGARVSLADGTRLRIEP